MNSPTSPLGSTWTRDVAQTRRLPRYARLAVASGVLCVSAFALLHILESDNTSVLKDPVSVYALTRNGSLLFGLGAVAMAAGCVAVLFGPLGIDTFSRWSLAAAAVFLLLVVGFETDAGAAVSTIGGYVHRYAAGAVFILITAAAVRARHRYRGTGYGRTVSAMLLVNVVLLVVNWSATYLPDLANGGQWRGVPQRLLLVILMVLLVAMSLAPRRVIPNIAPAWSSRVSHEPTSGLAARDQKSD